MLIRSILEELKAGSTGKAYWLYLRSFQSDNMGPDWEQANTGFTHTPELTVQPTLDELLMRGLQRKFGPAVCVGRKDFIVGAARIVSTDESWRTDVNLLARHASLIVLMPWDTDSVLEEFATIASAPELRRKTVFIMPPFAHGHALSRKWEKAIAHLKHLPLRIPSYEPSGKIFTFAGNSCTSFVLIDGDHVGLHIQRLLAGKQVQLGKYTD